MQPAISWTDPLPEVFANALASPAPARPLTAPTWRVIVLLLAAACLPRAVMAWKQDVVVPDGGLYITLAQRLDEGDFVGAFTKGLGLNTFPVVLMLLHRAGLDWELAGKLWSLSMSTLVVLPLFGWVRRQFNDRVALVACLLYACHTRFIQWGAEVFRDPTFWFVAVLYLYVAWRAATELRMWQFAAAGLTLFLAIHTRTEGWLLLIPTAIWAVWRYRHLAAGRWRLLCGNALALAVTPAAVLLINVTWLRDHPHWESGHLAPVLRIFRSAAAVNGPATRDGASPDRGTGFSTRPNPADAAGSRSASAAFGRGHGGLPLASAQTWRIRSTSVRKFTTKFAKAFEPIYGLCLLVGLWRWRRTACHVDQGAILLMNAALCGGIGVHVLKGMEINSRYFFLMVLTVSPYAALGLLASWRRCCDWAQRRGWRPEACLRVPAAVAAGLILIGPCVAWTEDYTVRRQAAALGRWLAAEHRDRRLIGCELDDTLVAFYAGKEWTRLPADDLPVWSRTIVDAQPQIVLISERRYRSKAGPDVAALCAAAGELGYREIPPSARPRRAGDHVFVRQAERPLSADATRETDQR